MRTLSLFGLLLGASAVPAYAQLVVPNVYSKPEQQRNSVSGNAVKDTADPAIRPQAPLMPPALAHPPSSEGDSGNRNNDNNDDRNGDLIVADVLPSTRAINIFAGLTRSVDGIAARLADAAQQSILLAPLNSAIQALPRKPWEEPGDYEGLGADAYEGARGTERAQENLRRFVESHVVPDRSWGQEAGRKLRALGGNEVWWVEEGGKRIIKPGNIEVERVAERVGNGEVWVVKGVVNYSV